MLHEISELSKKAKLTFIVETDDNDQMKIIVLFDLKDKGKESLNVTPLFHSGHSSTAEAELLQGIELFSKQSLGMLERIKFVTDSVKKAEKKVVGKVDDKKSTKSAKEEKAKTPDLFEASTEPVKAEVKTTTKVEGTLTAAPPPPIQKKPAKESFILTERTAEVLGLSDDYKKVENGIRLNESTTVLFESLETMPDGIFDNFITKWTPEKVPPVPIKESPTISLLDMINDVEEDKTELENRYNKVIEKCQVLGIDIGDIKFEDQDGDSITRLETVVNKLDKTG